MTTSPGSADLPAPPPRLIAQPLSICINCKYPLHAPPEQTRCPECGTPILDPNLDSPEFLRFADTDYLRTLRTGIRIALVGYTIEVLRSFYTFAAGIYGLILGFQIGRNPGHTPPTPTPQPLTIVDFITFSVAVLLMLLLLAGWWKLTTPEPTPPDIASKPDHRAPARVWMLIYAVAWIGTSIFTMLYMTTITSTPTPSQMLIIMLPEFLVLGIAIPMYIYIMLYMKWIAMRLPDRSAYSLARPLVWAAPLLATVGACILVGPLATVILTVYLLFKLHKGISALVEARDPSDATYPI
ncbi:MAG: hypothetical protein EA380_04255 [Phycisphaeraceae bacterium]|nr:MAG: hypothetical protein EA380_04255 [Phycisphaeraceae bacterium]